MEPAFTLACAIRLNGSKCELPSLSLPSGTDRGTIGDGARLHFGLCRPTEQAQCELPLLSLLQAPIRVATRLQSKSNACTKRSSLLARASVSLAMELASTLACAVRLNKPNAICHSCPFSRHQCELPLASSPNPMFKRPPLLARASVSLAALRSCSATMLAPNVHRCQPLQAYRRWAPVRS